ncbi:MAG TPA: mechanosensitive ion channel family protein, partial [Blastocatellia bacterium]
DFSVIMRAREFTDQYLIKHEFIKRLHERYRQEGVEIPLPARTVHIKERERAMSQGQNAFSRE